VGGVTDGELDEAWGEYDKHKEACERNEFSIELSNRFVKFITNPMLYVLIVSLLIVSFY
jgi:hypothetical protein